jgi:hypothetical protein
LPVIVGGAAVAVLVLAAAGFGVGEVAGFAAGLGVDDCTPAGEEACGVPSPAAGGAASLRASKLAFCHMVPRLSLLISNSIKPFFEFSGASGKAIGLPLIVSCAALASDRE